MTKDEEISMKKSQSNPFNLKNKSVCSCYPYPVYLEFFLALQKNK